MYFPVTLQARTLFANLEQFVGLPSHHTSGQSAPTPFHYTAENLSNASAPSPVLEQVSLTIGSLSRSSCIKASPLTGEPFSKDWLK